MKRSEAFTGSHLKQDDVPTPIVLAVGWVQMETLGQGADAETKPVLHFTNQHIKPMVLNFWNWNVLETAYGEDSDMWLNKPVEVYVDPNVMFGAKRVGGLRLRISSGHHATNGHAATGYGPSLMNWQMAVTALKGAGIAEDMLKQVLKSKGYSGYRADRDTSTVLEMIEEAKPKMQEESFDSPVGNEEIPFSFWIGLIGAGLSMAAATII